MSAPAPLATLLSRAFVAFTIEVDNEFEHRMPHQTSAGGRRGEGPYHPWLTSLVMWSTCLRFVDERGVTVSELARLARAETNLGGMQRWGYVTVEPDGKRPRPDSVVRARRAGMRAREVWAPLPGEIEGRWRDRFGAALVTELVEALRAVVGRLDPTLPDCLPILGSGLRCRLPEGREPGPDAVPDLRLHALLARVLLAFALEFESEHDHSLAVAANAVRVLDVSGLPLRVLPARSGVSAEAISMALGLLGKAATIVVEPDPDATRGKIVRLTERGVQAQRAHPPRLAEIEGRWQSAYDVAPLRSALERVLADETAVLAGLEPYPDGWRAAVRRRSVLPHFPMVLHRGGYPDGS